MFLENQRPILLVPGQGNKPPFPRGVFPDSEVSPMMLSEEIVSDAAGAVAIYKEPISEVWIWGEKVERNKGKKTIVYEEAEEMQKFILDTFPSLQGRTRIFQETSNTSTQARLIKDELARLDKSTRVTLLTTLDHDRRAIGNIQAYGTEIDETYYAHREYLNYRKTRGMSMEEWLERKRRVARAWINVPMYASMVREFGLNVIGQLDRKGLFAGNIASKFRGEEKEEADEDGLMDIFDADLFTLSSSS